MKPSRKKESFILQEKESLLQKAAGWSVVALVFLMPLKFGSISVMPEAAGFFPEDLFSWLIVNWPAHSFGLFSGAALLLTLAAFRIPDLLSCRGITMLLWCIGLPVAGLAGFINTPASFYAEGELYHLLGISAFCAAVFLILSGREQENWKRRLAGAFTAGIFLLCVSGLRQYFQGFEEMRNFIAQQEQQGVAVNGVLRAKAADNRVYSCMVSANVLAGFLLLCLPFAVVMFCRAGRLFEPVNLSVKIFLLIMLIPGVSVLLMTKTRAAFLCALIAGGLFFFTLEIKKHWKILLAAVILFCVAGGGFYIKYAGRGFGSLAERGDYLRTACIMLPEKPLAGHGWGGFFYRHMKEKTTTTDESAHDPHNVFLSFAVHCGIPAALVVCAAFFFPLAVLFRNRKTLDIRQLAGFWGIVAFTLHSCCDINMQIPACMAGAGLLFLLILPDEKYGFRQTPPAVKILSCILLAAVGISSVYCNYRWLRGEVQFTALFDMLSLPPDKIPPQETVLRQYRKVELLRKNHPFASGIMGAFFMAKNDFAAAEHFLRSSLDRDPGRPATYMRLAELASRRGDKENAQLLRRKAHSLFPSHPGYKLDKTP